jgi:hypothetical protein
MIETMAKGSMEDWPRRPGVVYFFAAGDPPRAIKIGMTTVEGKRDLKKSIGFRHRQIQSANPDVIRLLGIICFNAGEFPALDAQRREQELHVRFKKLQRFKDNTPGHEWFTATKELQDYIDLNCEPLPKELEITIGLPL